MPRLQFLTLCAVIAALSASAAATGRQRAQPSRVPPGASGMTFDVVVLDKDGRVPEAPLPAGALNGLASLLDAIRTVPGRKVVAFFSAGVANPSPAQLSAVAASATAARAAIYVFTLPGPRDDSALTLQAAPLEALAKAAGGALVSLGRNPERTIGRTAAELAACYTLELEPAAMDTDGKRHALRVEVAGRDLHRAAHRPG